MLFTLLSALPDHGPAQRRCQILFAEGLNTWVNKCHSIVHFSYLFSLLRTYMVARERMFVSLPPPQIQILILTPNMMVSGSKAFEKWWDHEDGDLMNGVSALIRENPESSEAFLTPCEDARLWPWICIRKPALTRYWICLPLDPRLPELLRDKHLFFFLSHPIFGIFIIVF